MKALVIIVVIAALLVVVVISMRECGVFGSLGPLVPASLSLAGSPATVPINGRQAFTVTATLATAAGGNGVVIVRIDEDDNWDDTIVSTVAIPIASGATSGSTTFTLTCPSATELRGDGSSTDEDIHQIHAEYRISLWSNVASANHSVQCVTAETPADDAASPPGDSD